MRKILLLLFIVTSPLFAQGFTAYDTVQVKQTKALTLVQKKNIVDNFANKIPAKRCSNKLFISKRKVKNWYDRLKRIDAYSSKLMMGAAVKSTDSLGNITYRKIPTNKAKLVTRIEKKFNISNELADYIVTKMIRYSKRTGNGNWAYYSAHFEKARAEVTNP